MRGFHFVLGRIWRNRLGPIGSWPMPPAVCAPKTSQSKVLYYTGVYDSSELEGSWELTCLAPSRLEDLGRSWM